MPVEFGGITFTPGAILTSDDDGIVVLDGLTEPPPAPVRFGRRDPRWGRPLASEAWPSHPTMISSPT